VPPISNRIPISARQK